MNKFLRNKILEAVQRGINLAIDDEDDDLIVSSPLKSGAIRDDYSVKDLITYKNLKYKFDKFTEDLITNDKPLPITYDEYVCFRDLSFKLGIKYIVLNKNELKRIVYNITRAFNPYDYNQNKMVYTNDNLNFLDVSRVTDMSFLFDNGGDFNCDISEWDVSNVIRMEYMFRNTKFNGDISKWNVSNVINMSNMFKNTPFNGDISNWDVSNVHHMSDMFSESKFNQPLDKWNVSNVEAMANMFEKCPFNQPLNTWDVSNVKTMVGMFRFSQFNQDISNWDVHNVDSFDYMFYNDTEFCQDISSWETQVGANHCFMFSGTIQDQMKMKNEYKPKFHKK